VWVGAGVVAAAVAGGAIWCAAPYGQARAAAPGAAGSPVPARVAAADQVRGVARVPRGPAGHLAARQPVSAGSLLSAPVPAACGHKAGRLSGGRLPGIPAHHGSMRLAWIDGGHREDLLALGDLDGDGTGDAAATLECDAGGVPWPELIAFYKPGPALLGAVGLGGINAPGHEPGENATVQRLRYAGGAVTAEWSTQEDGDPAAEANLDYTAVLRWNGHRITVSGLTASTERRTVDAFLGDLRRSDPAAAGKLAAPGVAAEAAALLDSHPDARHATPACYGANSPDLPAAAASLADTAGPRWARDADRVCLLPTAAHGDHDIALALHKTGFRKWRVADVDVV
jgi:hypothetical protein